MKKIQLNYPVKSQVITTVFGQDFSQNPIKRNFYRLFNYKHCGVDFRVPKGTAIFAAHDGIVVRKEFHKGMGRVISIRNGNIVTLYAHLAKFCIRLGQVVKQDRLIGYSGSTGTTSLEPHLHFEVRDITKKSLPEMVFKPEFAKYTNQYKTNFVYTIYNKNTKKSFETLARLYFGSKKYWRLIKNKNPDLNMFYKSSTLPEGLQVTIPNFQ